MTDFKRKKSLLSCLFWTLYIVNGFSQASNPWITLPTEKWPAIALTNHVQYKNGDRYVHPSFSYAGTGFLIDYKGKTFAITAKHILWVARNKNAGTVLVNNDLKQWIMKPTKDVSDSVIIDRLINED